MNTRPNDAHPIDAHAADITVVLAEAAVDVRAWLTERLTVPGIRVLRAVGTGYEVRHAVRRLHPDVLVMGHPLLGGSVVDIRLLARMDPVGSQ